jgi:hypothetical protein
MSSLVSGRRQEIRSLKKIKKKRESQYPCLQAWNTHTTVLENFPNPPVGDMPGRKIPGTSKKGQCVSGKRTSLPILVLQKGQCVLEYSQMQSTH